MECLSTQRLTYTYRGNESGIRDLSLNVPEGAIYGFLGPNGAGKTTTLRLILGLLKKQEGEVIIFGKSFQPNRIEILQKIGSLIESPSFYGHLTAIENLRVLQKHYQCKESRMQEVLSLVELAGTGKKKAGQFSLGMKQRLGIAMALLNNPSLLILDEPTNGLDPNGIIDIRELLKKLNREEGITILISSHLLAEIEKLVSHVGIIHKGVLLFEGTLNELVNKQQQGSQLVLATGDNERALREIASFQQQVKLEEGRLVMELLSKEQRANLIRLLVAKNIDVHELSVRSNDLESIFVELVNN